MFGAPRDWGRSCRADTSPTDKRGCSWICGLPTPRSWRRPRLGYRLRARAGSRLRPLRPGRRRGPGERARTRSPWSGTTSSFRSCARRMAFGRSVRAQTGQRLGRCVWTRGPNGKCGELGETGSKNWAKRCGGRGGSEFYYYFTMANRIGITCIFLPPLPPHMAGRPEKNRHMISRPTSDFKRARLA
jgi:hypothetical protein